MSTDAPTPQPPSNPPPPFASSIPGPFAHLTPPVDAADVERFKAEHAARMRESAKSWPGRKSRPRRR